LLLLVEDDVISQRIVLRQLGMLGYACHIANNGEEALEAFAFHAYALVLLDCHMPVMDGFETARRIRMLDRARGRRTPLVAITASSEANVRERCAAADMDGYLRKPIVREQLAELFERHLLPPAPQPVVATEAMFDLARQRDIFGDDRALRQHMLDQFANTSAPLVEQLGTAIAVADIDQARSCARQLAGACAAVGLGELTVLTHAIERAACERDRRRLEQMRDTMAAAFQRLRDYVDTKKEERR
jgi:CheY-like chemotaxis protein